MKLAAPVRHGRTPARLARPLRAGATSRSGVCLEYRFQASPHTVDWLSFKRFIVHFSIIPRRRSPWPLVTVSPTTTACPPSVTFTFTVTCWFPRDGCSFDHLIGSQHE